MWGSPGTMLAAQVMHERTRSGAVAAGVERVGGAPVGTSGADDLWQQDLYGSSRRVPRAGARLRRQRARARAGRPPRPDATRRARAACDRHLGRATPSATTGSASGRRCSSRPNAASSAIRTQWCHGAPGIVASLAVARPARRGADRAAARRRRADLAGRPAREGRRPLPRHGRQRLRVSQAVRAHRRRALARTRARVRDARRRTGRASPRASTAAAATRSGRATRAPPSTCTAAWPASTAFPGLDYF